MRIDLRVALCVGLGILCACGPRAHLPPRPLTVVGALSETDSISRLARRLAPLLYLQRDEWFPLERAVAVVHPTRPIIGYHLLWRDDVHGAWIPFTVPTDEEIVWIGYDPSGAPTDVWTYWHGKVLHADWRGRATPAVDVQWGKHGSLPRGTLRADLPLTAKPVSFYAMTWIGLPDIWLGNLTRPGPFCFCKSFKRYNEFTKPLLLGERVDLIAYTENPTAALLGLFGKPFSKKRPWP